MIGNAEDLEDFKENIQPLKQGRIVSQLSMALKAQSDSAAHQELLEQQRHHEIQIRSYEGDDPLEPWYDYVLWVEQSFVKNDRAGQLQLLLEKCLAKFKDDPRYKQDLRYIKLWITYIELHVHPQELYKSVFGHGIGTKSTLFYRSWAYEFERIKDFKTADKVYRLAFENCAEPKEDLDAAYQKFTLAVGQVVLGYEVPTPEKPLNEQRQVLSKLQAGKKGHVISRVGSAVQSRMPGKLKSVQMESNVQGCTIKIFNEAEGSAVDSCPSSELQCIPRREVLNKENTLKPGPWTNARRKTRHGVAALPVARAATLQFPIHEDEAVELYSAQSSNDLMPALKVRKEQVCDLKCPIAVFEEPDASKRPMYCKDKVYAGNVEFSFEELRANIYRKRYAQRFLEGVREGTTRQSNEVEVTRSCCVIESSCAKRLGSRTDEPVAACWAANENLPPATLAQHCAQNSLLRNVDYDTQSWKQHDKDTDEFVVPELRCQSRAVFDGVNLDQSSVHSQSITVNTKEALKTVSELWKTPKDEWSPANKTRNVYNPPFPDNDVVKSEVKSLPFQIYIDDQSACQDAEQKPVKSIWKVPPQIFLQPPPEQLAANFVGTVLDKENVKFPMFHDDEDESLCHPDPPKNPKLDIPFVPSPGMSEEELSKLRGSESKENIVPLGLAAVEKVRQVATDGVLQPSKTVPFLPLEVQETFETECDDLGVQRLPDNSEIGNETCNTQAFSFPLPSSTPFTIHSRKPSTHVDEPEPEEGTINLMMNGKQKQDQPEIVRDDNLIHPEVPAPSAGSDNLSVILESSREYRSSSSSGSSGLVVGRATYSVKESLEIIEELSSRCGDVWQSDCRGNHPNSNNVYAIVEETNTEVQVVSSSVVHCQEESTTVPSQLSCEGSQQDNTREMLGKMDDVSSGHPVLTTLMNLKIDSVFDPFSDKVQEMILKRENFPKGFDSNYMRCASDRPAFKSSCTVILGTEKYMLSEIIGKGAYAKVMKAINLKTEEVVALKVQRCSSDWEFYISRQIRKRLGDKSMVAAFIYPDMAFTYKNGSVLVLDWLPYGTLLTVCNRVRERTGRSLNHLVATFWTRELLCIMQHLMKCSIIHGDMKPDNLMLQILPTVDLQVPSLKLIDFGRSIDMLQFPTGTAFKKVVTTDSFQGIEMQTKRAWTYQTDLYGVAGIAHCLLFGNYMKTCKRKSVDEWTIESTFPRYCCREMWKNFFTTLLNIENCEQIPDLVPLEAAFQRYLDEQKASLSYAFINMNNILSGK